MSTYSFLSVVASITGPGLSASLAEGAQSAEEGLTVEMEGDKNTMTPGAGGAVMHSLHAAKNGKITVRLLKTSPVNAILSQAYASQTANPALHGQNVITVNDTARGDDINAVQVAFSKLPNITYAKEGAMNEWVFDCGKIDQILGSGTLSTGD